MYKAVMCNQSLMFYLDKLQHITEEKFYSFITNSLLQMTFFFLFLSVCLSE